MQRSIDPHTFLNHNFFFLKDWEIIRVKSMDAFRHYPEPQNQKKEWEIVSLPAAAMWTASKPVL